VPAFFFDSSGIVKRYVNEIGTPWVLSLVAPAAGNRIYVARITGVEVVSAVSRRQRSGSLPASEATIVLTQFRHDFAAEYRVVAITAPLLTLAMILAETHALRGYDAVQLSAALILNSRRLAQGLPALTLVSSDAELNAAATVEGLMVEDPVSHP
jgi:predicted nucleic acid-binding protein